MAVYAIGDLQGCHDEFLILLDRIAFEPGRDQLWLTGDLVNRGPKSLEVLRSVRSLGDDVTVVLGNHDLHLLAIAARHRPARLDPSLEDVLTAPDRDELLGWLASLPLMHRDRDLDWAMVHAGLPPQWTVDTAEALAREVATALADDTAGFLGHMYGNEPSLWSPVLPGPDRLRFAVNCLTRLRYVDAQGRLLLRLKGPPADAPRGAIPWFRHPARASADTRIAFGHWSALGFLREQGVLSLDAGCVWGGALCAARLDRDEEPVCLDCRGSLRPGTD